MRDIVNKVKFNAVKDLTRQVLAALENATLQIEEQANSFAATELPPVREESQHVAERFMMNMNAKFDELVLNKMPAADEEPDIDGMTMVDHDYLEAIIAMEGMVNHARNTDISEYLSFSTRLDSIFPNLKIDETNNPLDPEQIGDSFNAAIKPLGLKAHYLLTIYREFNKAVFHNLETVLVDANKALIDLGVMPSLDMKARNREAVRTKRAANRPKTDPKARAFAEAEQQPELTEEEVAEKNAAMFEMLQKLVHAVSSSAAGQLPITAVISDSPSPQQAGLMNMLTEEQNKLANMPTAAPAADQGEVDGSTITASLNSSLETGQQSGDIDPIGAQSADVLNLVTLIYEAIWSDDSVPLVMRELIGRTQISTMKLALTDITFFGDEQHPGRAILNEFAMAGISWTEPDMVANDPIYSKVRELVERILGEPKLSNEFLQSLIDELRVFKGQQSGQDVELEQRLREGDEHSHRIDDVDEFVTQKINERILKPNLDPSIRNLLDTYFHNFLVKLVLKEGPGGSSWKPVMSTIDVLLWTVQAERHPGDRDRFDKINPRLLDNLTKALEIGGASKSRITKIMRQLKQVQEYSFHKAATEPAAAAAAPTEAPAKTAAAAPSKHHEPPPLPRDDPHLRQVDKLPIGVWLEFKGVSGTPVRCTLAAKIDSIDKMFFINRQGVKVVELTRMRLAHELKAGSVKIVSEGSLVDRAMESVISGLRDAAPKQAPDAA